MKNIKLILTALLIMTGLSAHAQEQVVEAQSATKTTELALATNPKLVIGASEVSFTDRKNTTTFSASERIVLRIKTKEAPAPTTYTITATSANTTMGTVTGGGTYEEGKTVTLTATPKSGYRFVKWSDGTTANPYTFKATKNVTLTARFETITYDYTVKLVNAPKDAKVTIDGKSYADGAKFTTKKQLQASDVKATYAGYTTNVKIQNYVITVTYTKTTDGVESVAADEAETAVNYDLTGRKVSQKTKVRGVNLQKMNDGTTKKVLTR